MCTSHGLSKKQTEVPDVFGLFSTVLVRTVTFLENGTYKWFKVSDLTSVTLEEENKRHGVGLGNEHTTLADQHSTTVHPLNNEHQTRTPVLCPAQTLSHRFIQAVNFSFALQLRFTVITLLLGCNSYQ